MASNDNDENDPGYSDFHKKDIVDRNKILKEDTKNQTIKKINTILNTQFSEEISAKEHEISKIEKRIQQNKILLDRLRAYVVASYYGAGEELIPVAKAVPVNKKKRSANDEKETDGGVIPVKKLFEEKSKCVEGKDAFFEMCTQKLKKEVVDSTEIIPEANPTLTTNRFYVEKDIIVGNVSKYLLADSRKENDKSTHKWMVYVRGASDKEDISSFVKSVWFYLHPSYIPNDVVHVNSPPFQLTRRGWGEFPVRVQLHFVDAHNKKTDIIHNLKLDKTYTGLQTLGAETVVKLELHRHSSEAGEASNFFMAPSVPRVVKTQIKTEPCDQLEPLVYSKNAVHEVSQEKSTTKTDSSFTRIFQSESLVSSCRSTPASSRCTSPVMNSIATSLIDNPQIVYILHELITDAPLFDVERDMHINSFACNSFDKYKKWYFSKRRASEWQRAIFVKKLFVEYIDINKKNLKVPTTKQIMIWCRRYGHVPPEINSVVSHFSSRQFCKCCGKILHEPTSGSKWCLQCVREFSKMTRRQTLTNFNSILDNLSEKEETLKRLKALTYQSSQDNQEIDVVTVGQNQESNVDKKVEVNLASNPQLMWIYDTASDIDIHLPSITIESVRAPLLQIMLRTALKLFASEVLRTANFKATENSKTSLEPVLISTHNIAEAVRSIPKFDFLTDEYLGKNET